MKVTNLLKAAILFLFIAFALPATSNAMHVNSIISTIPADSTSDAIAVAKIVQRVYEIQSLDKTNLSSAEKKALRNELKGLKAEAQEKGNNNGIYLSIGAVIVIILLLILLLK